MAHATRPIARQNDQPAPLTMAALHTRAQSIGSLQELTGLFAQSIAADGFASHLCFGIAEDGGIAPLFGDARSLPVRPNDGRVAAIRPDFLLLSLTSWHGGDMFIGLGGRDAPVPGPLRASLQGRSEVYATFGLALLERERDLATASGLGLEQRRCLARVLMGERDPQIADTLGITPLAVRGHIEGAMKILSARSRPEAVSIAARRGWLADLNFDIGEIFAPN